MNVLAISPHTDDIELGAGASISRWLAERNEVYVVALSTGNPETGATEGEFEAAMEALGVPEWTLTQFPCRSFHEHRQEILDLIFRVREEFIPDLVLGPSRNNIHQDHQVVMSEMMRAFREISILGYEMPWGDYGFSPQMYVKVQHRHVQDKYTAIAQYASQSPRLYTTKALISGLLHLRGTQIGEDFAEAYEVIRWVI